MKRNIRTFAHASIRLALIVCLALAAVLLSGQIVNAEAGKPFVIGGFDYSRGANYSFSEGPSLVASKASITTNFPEASFTSFPTVTPEALEGVDVLMLTSVRTNTTRIVPLSADEQDALLDYIKGGGCAILFPENSTFGYGGAPASNQSLIDPFGMTIHGTINGRVIASIPDSSAHPITDGAYGMIDYISQNYPGGLSDLGPYAYALAENPLGYALAVIEDGVISPGSGRVIVYTDLNTFGNHAGFFKENEALYLNTIAYCAESLGIEVAIDIKPGSLPNCVNNNGRGAIPVAVFGGPEFDVATIDPGTLVLAEALPVKTVGKHDKLLAHYEDVDMDGYDDLVVQFEDIDNVFSEEDNEATVTGVLYDGTSITGTDSICLVP